MIPVEESVVPLEKSMKRMLQSSGKRDTRARCERACMGVSDAEEEEEEGWAREEARRCDGVVLSQRCVREVSCLQSRLS